MASSIVQMHALVCSIHDSLWQKRCDVLFTGRDDFNQCKILCFARTENEESVPRRVVHAQAHGGLFWISPEFQKDLVHRNGLSAKMEKDLDDGVHDEYDEQAYAADVQVGEAVIDMVRETELRAEDEELEEYSYIPWKECLSNEYAQGIVIRSLKYVTGRMTPTCREEDATTMLEAREAARINPYVKRMMDHEDMDSEALASIQHPRLW